MQTVTRSSDSWGHTLREGCTAVGFWLQVLTVLLVFGIWLKL